MQFDDWFSISRSTYDKTFVGSLLPFLVHGDGCGFGKGSDDGEDGETDAKADGNAPGHAGAASRGVDSTRAVRTKGDPVC